MRRPCTTKDAILNCTIHRGTIKKINKVLKIMKNIYSLIAIIVSAILKVVGIGFILSGLNKVLEAYVHLPKPILNSIYPIILGASIIFIATKMLKEASKE